MREIWILDGKRRQYIVKEDGQAVEILRDPEREETGGIFLGKVNRIALNLHAAFVDYGTRKDGFLPLEENSRSFAGGAVRSGMTVAVQVKKEAHGEKGAFLTRDLTLPGETMILMPLNRHVGVSARITDEDQRKRLNEIGHELSQGEYGIVMRSGALNADFPKLTEERDRLAAQWSELAETLKNRSRPGQIFSPGSMLEDLVRDYGPRGIDRIVTDDDGLADTMKSTFATEVLPTERIASEIKNTLKQALKRKVNLIHGGNLVIDPCEALTVFDVNTASDMRRKSGETGYLATNLEACDEIARQVRLRNLSGMILIDMIDLKTEEDRQAVLERLRQAFEADRIKTVIHGMTELGLVEMTRKRTYCSVYEDRTVSCEQCGGSGRILCTEEEKK